MTERTCRNCEHFQVKVDSAGFATYLCAFTPGLVLGGWNYRDGDELWRDTTCEKWEEERDD